MVIKYKLTLIEDSTENRELCLVGYFNNEEELKRWAEQCNGELEKVNEKPTP